MSTALPQQLPFSIWTPPRWAEYVLKQPLALLNDHAWLEKKAASNALELLNRWPELCPPENWVQQMTAIARDEVEHLGIVVRLLARRGGELAKSHSSPYAADLRKLVRSGHGPLEVLDRLLVSALIEARSCERFFVLAKRSDDRELAKLYHGLYASEAGHYRVFLGLAKGLPDDCGVQAGDVDVRWEELLQREGEIVLRQPIGPTMHGGVP
ncbi:MAG: tRNA-(ms[2]io[6]A)-hydroxylase [Phycisphaerae bacterium]